METEIKVKKLKGKNGWLLLFIVIAAILAGLAMAIAGFILVGGDETPENPAFFALAGAGLVVVFVSSVCLAGFKVLAPNEAIVLTLFGKYHGTLEEDGFWFVNPFCSAKKPIEDVAVFGKAMLSKKLSLKAMTLNNDKQKVNDEEGNPIEISVVVIWRIADCAKAVFCVDNYMTFISTQCDSAIRQVARQYPYDVSEGGDEKSLRGSSQEIADVLKAELQ